MSALMWSLPILLWVRERVATGWIKGLVQRSKNGTKAPDLLVPSATRGKARVVRERKAGRRRTRVAVGICMMNLCDSEAAGSK